MPDKSVANRGGRPRKHQRVPGGPDVPRVVVVLPSQDVAGLDRLCIDLRQHIQARIDRSAIIRALVEGLLATGINLTSLVPPAADIDAEVNPSGIDGPRLPARTIRATEAEGHVCAWVRDRLSQKRK